MGWFGVVSLYDWRKPHAGVPVYEQRVVMFRAASQDEAMAKAEIEAATYANDNAVAWTGYLCAYRCDAGEISDGFEAFSLLRKVACGVEEFEHRFSSGSFAGED
ncbi:MAG TPA: hypothetical protein VEL07_23655 [Planctomycetota bacterium]|nr:hypothetical protein [Planctomycetota bacterium]